MVTKTSPASLDGRIRFVFSFMMVVVLCLIAVSVMTPTPAYARTGQSVGTAPSGTDDGTQYVSDTKRYAISDVTKARIVEENERIRSYYGKSKPNAKFVPQIYVAVDESVKQYDAADYNGKDTWSCIKDFFVSTFSLTGMSDKEHAHATAIANGLVSTGTAGKGVLPVVIAIYPYVSQNGYYVTTCARPSGMGKAEYKGITSCIERVLGNAYDNDRYGGDINRTSTGLAQSLANGLSIQKKPAGHHGVDVLGMIVSVIVQLFMLSLLAIGVTPFVLCFRDEYRKYGNIRMALTHVTGDKLEAAFDSDDTWFNRVINHISSKIEDESCEDDAATSVHPDNGDDGRLGAIDYTNHHARGRHPDSILGYAWKSIRGL